MLQECSLCYGGRHYHGIWHGHDLEVSEYIFDLLQCHKVWPMSPLHLMCSVLFFIVHLELAARETGSMDAWPSRYKEQPLPLSKDHLVRIVLVEARAQRHLTNLSTAMAPDSNMYDAVRAGSGGGKHEGSI